MTEECVTCHSEFKCSREEYIGECDIYRGECFICHAPLCISCVGSCPSCGKAVCEQHAAAHPDLPHQSHWCSDCLAGDESLQGVAA